MKVYVFSINAIFKEKFSDSLKRKIVQRDKIDRESNPGYSVCRWPPKPLYHGTRVAEKRFDFELYSNNPNPKKKLIVSSQWLINIVRIQYE